MEFIHNGELVRQYHPGTTYTISRVDGTIYHIHRSRGNNYRQIIGLYCASPFASKLHCEIFRRDSAYWITDLASTNGTFLNGFRLTPNSTRELRFGDIIGIGVSHVVRTHIDPTDEQYYIFEFQQALYDEDPSHNDSSGFGEWLAVED